ncbi:MAG: tRNA (adenosine(37)-N6)-dimethylallyltransferase MiaA [Gammaproteobacteria bacterium]|nr:tRNA (adenosine(37)-N6)-dimethylallyltransferase MiaA [Gammaproteobacteria bacterium]MBP9728784.1 tRNA (adenosine(37)-N6)-dimethylallyltransferase MiaA [Gammaproteobacteria bacterium]
MPTHTQHLPLAILLMGPTAVGKSHLALELAQHLPLEIISVDSAIVYRGMDIGTSKPSAAERKAVPHHLIDIRDPTEVYSAAAFVQDALVAMRAISERGNIPLLVGGTIFYFRALMQGLSPLPSADPVLRAALTAEADRLGWPALHQRLALIDPQAAQRIHPQDRQRIQRALEVYTLTQKSLSTLCAEQPSKPQGVDALCAHGYRMLSFARMQPDRRILHQHIAERFHAMLEQGLVAEVEALWQHYDLTPSMPSMRAVGYRQIKAYLDGDTNAQTMTEQAMAATRQLAKRQISWITQMPQIQVLENTHLASKQTMLDCVVEGTHKLPP